MAKPCPFSRPIPFTGPMIKALLDGRKTQTRRALHLPAVKWLLLDPALGSFLVRSDGAAPTERRFLWVREWVQADEVDAADGGDSYVVRYLADDTEIPVATDITDDAYADWFNLAAYRSEDVDLDGNKPVPPMHMPRWVSRLTLEIDLVRVQRLQEIGEEDARAEGIVAYPDGWHWQPNTTGFARLVGGTAQRAFAGLWEEINGDGSWQENPKVCAITFKLHHQNIDALLIERGLKEPPHA